MKVLLINNCFFRRGGSEAVLFNTADLLKNHGHEVVFFSFADEKNEKTDDKEYFIEWGGTLKKMKGYFYNSDAARKLDDILCIEKPDIAHVHLLWGGMGQSIFHVLRKHKVPLVHTVHDYRMVCPAYTFKDGHGRQCEKCQQWNYYNCALNRCNKGSLIQSIIMTAEMYTRQLFHNPTNHIDGFIFVSRFAENKHIAHNKHFAETNRVVLYNYTRPMLVPDISKKEDYYLFFGRLSFEKGVKTLIEAFAKLPKERLKVVGTGPLEDILKQYCLDMHLNNVEFLGYKKGTPLYELVRNAKFVCVPSEWYENNPMTIIESYSMGTPVIGARIGGIPEIIEQGHTGYCFESRSVDDLVRVIEQSSKTDDIKYPALCQQSYEFYKANFSADQHYETLINFYNKVIKNYKLLTKTV